MACLCDKFKFFRAAQLWETPAIIAPWLILVFWLNSFNGFVPCATLSLAFVLLLHIGTTLVSRCEYSQTPLFDKETPFFQTGIPYFAAGIIFIIGALSIGTYLSLDNYLRPLPYIIGIIIAEILRVTIKKGGIGKMIFAFVYTPLLFMIVSKLVTTLYVPKMMLICITLSLLYVAFAIASSQKEVQNRRGSYIFMTVCIALAFINLLALILTQAVPMNWYYVFICLPLVNELVKSASAWSKGNEIPVNYSWWLNPLCGVKESDKPSYRFREVVARNIFVLACIIICFLVPVTV